MFAHYAQAQGVFKNSVYNLNIKGVNSDKVMRFLKGRVNLSGNKVIECEYHIVGDIEHPDADKEQGVLNICIIKIRVSYKKDFLDGQIAYELGISQHYRYDDNLYDILAEKIADLVERFVIDLEKSSSK